MTTSDTSSTNANVEMPPETAAHGINVTIGKKLRPATESGFDRLCGNCGYSLQGSPNAGVCPECGEAYFDDEIVIRGWPAGPYESLATAAPRRLWPIALGWLIWTACLWSQVADNLVHHHIARGVGWAAVILGIAACLLYRRQNLITQFGCTAHLRLSPKGFGQREGFGAVMRTPWASTVTLKLIPRPRGAFLLGVWRIRDGKRKEPKPHHWLIGFEFACTPDQAKCLRLLMQAWIARATAECPSALDR